MPAMGAPVTPVDKSGNVIGAGSAAGSSATGVPVSLAGGSDGTNVRAMSVDTSGRQYVVENPSTVAAAGIVPVATTAVASSLVLKASAGNLYGVNCVAGASAGYLMLFNSTTAPADGAVTPLKVMPIAANAGMAMSFEIPVRFSTGCTAVFSTTGPFTKTASATAFISGEIS